MAHQAPETDSVAGDDIGASLRAALAPPRRRAFDRAHPFVWAAYAVLTALVVGYVVVDALGVDWSWLNGWGVDAFEIVTGVLCILKGADLKRGRAVPVLLGIGLLCWAAGDVVLTIQSLGGATPPSPSIADGFYVTFYPVTYFALMLMLRSSVKRFSLATWLDGAVAGFGAAARVRHVRVQGRAAPRRRDRGRGGGQPGLPGRRRAAARTRRRRRRDRARQAEASLAAAGRRLCPEHRRRHLQRARLDVVLGHPVQRHRLAGGDSAGLDRSVGQDPDEPALAERRASRIRAPGARRRLGSPHLVRRIAASRRSACRSVWPRRR